MPVTAIIGGQWGDEGKGRIVDLLAQQSQMVIRYGGGNNAGHTVINNLGTFKLHLVPAGIFNPTTINIIGAGTVIDPAALLDELAMLRAANVAVNNLRISDRAHVIMPYHREQDRIQEALRGDGRIGTTGRGIGPAYSDKIERVGVRMGDLADEQALRTQLAQLINTQNRLFAMYGAAAQSLDTTLAQYIEYGRQLRPYIVSTHALVQQALRQDQHILLEGAQATLLDIDWGTYPYVTSSLPGAAGACQGAGIGPHHLEQIVGVFKAYATRVGSGPFPTELLDDTGDLLRERGHEYGTTTGRPRRCGWFDAQAARYVAELNSLDTIALTKLDVLDDLPTIQICTGYQIDDQAIDDIPSTAARCAQITPVYETLPGWQSNTSTARTFDDLPPNAQRYIARLEELVGVPVTLISVGPARDALIERHALDAVQPMA